MQNHAKQNHVRRGVACIAMLVLAGGFAQLDHAAASSRTGPTTVWGTQYQSYSGSQMMTVAANIRTFAAGHKDFPRASASTTPGRYMGVMSDTLGPDGKPLFESSGYRVLSDWKDSAGHVMMRPRSYMTAVAGDAAGSLDSKVGGAVESAQTFFQWFRDSGGVNSSSRVNFDLTRSNGVSVFDGSLDSYAAGGSKDYTAEMEYTFVNENGKNWYVDVASNAEAWVYVDDRLVIDGGGMGGAGAAPPAPVPLPASSFSLSNGSVIPSEACDATVTIVGAAIQSGSTPCPVTARITVGGKVLEPFGSFSSPTTANLNDGKNPRTSSIGASIPAGTAISVTGQSWKPGSSPSSIMVVESPVNSKNARVLRNGDTAPDIKPFQNQTSLKGFLAPYVDAAGRVRIDANQAIYLFELGTTDVTSSAADFQDLVVLVSMNRPGTTGSSSASSTPAAPKIEPAPDMHQRIDLSRLTWLEDRGSYRMKILFANRTGAASKLRVETNINTLNLVNQRVMSDAD